MELCLKILASIRTTEGYIKTRSNPASIPPVIVKWAIRGIEIFFLLTQSFFPPLSLPFPPLDFKPKRKRGHLFSYRGKKKNMFAG